MSSHQGKKVNLTRETGCPVGQNHYSLSAGPFGPLLVPDLDLLEKIGLFNREKIPPRNVHALGVGAYGTFTCTNDLSRFTCAKLFQLGKKTDLFARFSGIFTEQGDADTTRDPRGFAMKFYTEEGNWDLLGINTPVFNVRDAKMGPDAVHACKRDSRTGMWNLDQTWDFCANHPESLHQFLMIYTDRSGTPMSFRHMDAYGCHTFSLWNSNNERHWVKFHFKCVLGAKGLTKEEAKAIAGEDPNFLSRDLVNAIQQGHFPKWKMYCQIMEEKDGFTYPFAFDCTKCWKHKDYPLIEVGEVEINRNVTDHHSETEQATFSPATIVPGIGLSPDKLLQGRLLIYDDTQYHRLGPNFKHLPVNCPRGVAETHTTHIGGQMNFDSRNHFPHYADSCFGAVMENPAATQLPLKVNGDSGYYKMPMEGSDEDFYEQPRDFIRILSQDALESLCKNIAASLQKVTVKETLDKMFHHFGKIDPNVATTIQHFMQKREKGEGKSVTETILEQKLQDLMVSR